MVNITSIVIIRLSMECRCLHDFRGGFFWGGGRVKEEMAFVIIQMYVCFLKKKTGGSFVDASFFGYLHRFFPAKFLLVHLNCPEVLPMPKIKIVLRSSGRFLSFFFLSSWLPRLHLVPLTLRHRAHPVRIRFQAMIINPTPLPFLPLPIHFRNGLFPRFFCLYVINKVQVRFLFHLNTLFLCFLLLIFSSIIIPFDHSVFFFASFYIRLYHFSDTSFFLSSPPFEFLVIRKFPAIA